MFASTEGATPFIRSERLTQPLSRWCHRFSSSLLLVHCPSGVGVTMMVSTALHAGVVSTLPRDHQPNRCETAVKKHDESGECADSRRSRTPESIPHVRRFFPPRLRGAFRTCTDHSPTAPRSLLHLYRPFSGGSWEPFLRGPAIQRRLRGGGRLWSRDQTFKSHFIDVSLPVVAFEFDSSISMALFASAFDDVLPSMTAIATAKSLP